MQGKALIITGTDTGVGKTLVTGGLAGTLRNRGYRVGNMKPAESGCPVLEGKMVPQDALFVKNMAGCESPLETICPYRFQDPLAPFVAAEREEVDIKPERIVSAFEELRASHDVTLIEGVGGFLVPIARDFGVPDLAIRFDVPLLIVGRLGLGTLNHTLLTIEAAEQRGLQVLGVVLNAVSPPGSIAEQTNPVILISLTGTPLLGVLPHLPTDEAGPKPDLLIQAVEEHLDVSEILTDLGLLYLA